MLIFANGQIGFQDPLMSAYMSDSTDPSKLTIYYQLFTSTLKLSYKKGTQTTFREKLRFSFLQCKIKGAKQAICVLRRVPFPGRPA